jgi:hypothetical protein
MTSTELLDFSTSNETRALSASEKVVGSGYLFWIRANNMFLGHELCHRVRVKPSCVLKNKKYGISSIFFLECRNLNVNNPSQKGFMCAVWFKGQTTRDPPRLGIIRCAQPFRDYIEILLWRGETLQTKKSNTIIPMFYLMNRKNYCGDDIFYRQFSVFSGKMSDVRVIYMKQVSGYLPFLKNVNTPLKNLIDPHDGCFSVGMHTPEMVSLPKGYTSKSITDERLMADYPDEHHFEVPKGGKKRKSMIKNKTKGESNHDIFNDDHEYEKISSAFNVCVMDCGQATSLHKKGHNPSSDERLLSVPLLTKEQKLFFEKRNKHGPGGKHSPHTPFRIKFAMIKNKHSKYLFSITGQLFLEDFNNCVTGIAVSIHELLYFPRLVTSYVGRIKLMEEKLYNEFNKATFNYEVAHYVTGENINIKTYRHETVKAAMGEGITVSSWEYLGNKSCFNMNKSFCNRMRMTINKGYGSRSSTLSRGINMYVGNKNSSRGHPTPLNGKSTINKIPYHRAVWKYPQYLHCMINSVRKFSKYTTRFS